MTLGLFGDVRRAMVTAGALLGEAFDCSPAGTPWDLDVMRRVDRFPELARSFRRLEASVTLWERAATLGHAEEALGDAQELLRHFDPVYTHLEAGDPYGPDEARKDQPEL